MPRTATILMLALGVAAFAAAPHHRSRPAVRSCRFRCLGLCRQPASELRVCRELESSVVGEMPASLRTLAGDVERRWHELLDRSPG